MSQTKPTTFSKKSYLLLTKPGIMMGNAITILAGFFLASRGTISWLLLFATVVGLSLLVSSSCVVNNLIDRVADARMDRTKRRSMALKAIPRKKIVAFAAILGVVGAGILLFFTNLYAFFIGLFGFFVYVVLYSFLKYFSYQGTLVGSVAGAVPPVVGYTAVSHEIDLGAWILFVILVIWQMPHFYAIAIFRMKDYRAASIPVLPIVKGIKTTKVHMLLYVIIFIGVSSLLSVFDYTGNGYLGLSLILGLGWLILSIKGFSKKINNELWARQMFKYSLIVITALSIAMMLNYR